MKEITLNLKILNNISVGCIESVGREILEGISVKDRETVSGYCVRSYTTTNGKVCLREMELLEKSELKDEEIIIHSKDLDLTCKKEKMKFMFIDDVHDGIVNEEYKNNRDGLIRLINGKYPDNVDNILDCGTEKPKQFLLYRAANMKIVEKFLDIQYESLHNYGQIFYKELSTSQKVIYFKKGLKIAALITVGLGKGK